MSTNTKSFGEKWSGFFGDILMQIRAAMVIGLPAEDGTDSRAQQERDGASLLSRSLFSWRRQSSRSLEDPTGYQTRNGLGSLDIGAGHTRIGE
jgi:hypothetical protein